MHDETYRQKCTDLRALQAEAARMEDAGEAAEAGKELRAIRARIAQLTLELANEQFR